MPPFALRPPRTRPFSPGFSRRLRARTLPIGFWDLAFPGDDAQRLSKIERVCRASAPSFCHWSRFLVAEVDGKPAAGLSGYDEPTVAAGSALMEAFGEVFTEIGWGPAEGAAMQERVAPFLTCIPETPEDVWVVEWVATSPQHRGKGLIKSLLHAILDRGIERGFKVAQIGVLIGNTAAQRAYEGVGFRVADEKRDPTFEAALGCPGIRRMLR